MRGVLSTVGRGALPAGSLGLYTRHAFGEAVAWHGMAWLTESGERIPRRHYSTRVSAKALRIAVAVAVDLATRLRMSLLGSPRC